jgi:hypothetical protein
MIAAIYARKSSGLQLDGLVAQWYRGSGEPMAVTQLAKPFNRPGWIYEEKYDGWRMVAYKDGGAARGRCHGGKARRRSLRHLHRAGPTDARAVVASAGQGSGAAGPMSAVGLLVLAIRRAAS